jgi:DNA-binding CsgD family transcriptional regulator
MRGLFKLGKWQRGRNLALQAATYAGSETSLMAARLELAKLDIASGRLREAAGHLATLPGPAEREQPEFDRARIEQVAELALAQGEPEAAYAAATAGLRRIAGTPQERHAGRLALLGLTASADRAERGRNTPTPRPDEIRTALADAARLTSLTKSLRSGPFGAEPDRSMITYEAVRATWDAQLTRLHGRSDPAAWKRAASCWTALSRPQPAAIALLRAAEAAAAGRGRRPDAIECLRAASRQASELGAQLLLDEARRLGDLLHVSVDVGKDLGQQQMAYHLSPREFEVLVLVAKGLTDPQIARRLFISPKTVGTHVSHILAKLHVAGRVQATALAHRESLLPDTEAEPDAVRS